MCVIMCTTEQLVPCCTQGHTIVLSKGTLPIESVKNVNTSRTCKNSRGDYSSMAANINLLQPQKHFKVQSCWSTLIYDSNLRHFSQLCCFESGKTAENYYFFYTSHCMYTKCISCKHVTL